MTEHEKRSHDISGIKKMFDIDPGLSAFLKGEVISRRRWSALLFEQNLRGNGPEAVAAACASAGYSTAVCMDIDEGVYETFDIEVDVAGLEKARRQFHSPSYAIIETDENFIIVSDGDYYWSIAGPRPFVESIFNAPWKDLLDGFEMGIEPYTRSKNSVVTRIAQNLTGYLNICRLSFSDK